MEKKRQNDMDTGIMQAFKGFGVGFRVLFLTEFHGHGFLVRDYIGH